MAVLKYKDENGQFVTLTNYSVQPITPVQTTGTSLSDIMSQKAVTDELNKKVNDSDLNGKIATAISSEDTVKGAIANVVTTSPTISGAINTVVADSIKNDDTVNTAVEEAVAAAIAADDSVKEAVETVVDTKLTAYTSTEDSDLRYAFKEHTHEVSAINGFDDAVAESVKTEITNNNSAITESINSVVEKYIYGEGGASQDAEVVTTDNLNTTLADYAKSSSLKPVATSGSYNDLTDKPSIPTKVTDLTDAGNYVKNDDINTLVSEAIKTDSTVSGAVTDAVAEAIASDDTVKEAVEAAIAEDTTVSSKFGHVAYDSDSKHINFYASSTSSDVIEFIDATDFIKDGMVDNVEIKDGNLVITFNTDTSKEDISIPLTSIFDPSNYYTTGQTSGATEIANALNGKANSTHEHASSSITTMGGYSKPLTTSAIATSDSLNAAIGKLECKIDAAVAGGVSTVSLGSGSTNGSITLSVNGTLQDTITVPGLGSAAYKADTYFATASHTHTSSQIDGFSSAVEGVVSTSTTITTRINTVVASAITDSTGSGSINEAINNAVASALTASTGDVKEAVDEAIEANTAVTASKAVTDFYSGHNTVTSLADIPTDKRLVIATISDSTNELSLSDNTLADGYEIHVIVKNNGTEEVTVTLPSDGTYVTVGDTIKIAAGKYGEINIISDGTSLYVRGA